MNLPDFRNPQTLVDHIRHTMAFYHPASIDPSGGFYHFFKDDGCIYDARTRHLVSSTRFVFNNAMAWRQFKDPAYLAATRHGLAFLRDAHRNPVTGGYAWELDWHEGAASIKDATNHCYGLAFVVLAYSQGIMAGVEEAEGWLDETWQLMEEHFWEPQHGLYADEATPDWQVLPYRGQNANMHACEAMLTAYEATKNVRYLDRAELLARNITERQTALAGNLIWEHYDSNWQVDWEYNKEDKTNIFRPWGYQPGHLAEWAKLLLILERHRPAPWQLPRAEQLFGEAMKRAWDEKNGGLVYGFGPVVAEGAVPVADGLQTEVCDSDKYFWVQAESLAAAALLAHRTGKAEYWEDYQRLWAYAWTHFVDHQHGGWWRILRGDNSKYSDEKSPAGKVDYHTMGACYEVLNVL